MLESLCIVLDRTVLVTCSTHENMNFIKSVNEQQEQLMYSLLPFAHSFSVYRRIVTPAYMKRVLMKRMDSIQ